MVLTKEVVNLEKHLLVEIVYGELEHHFVICSNSRAGTSIVQAGNLPIVTKIS